MKKYTQGTVSELLASKHCCLSLCFLISFSSSHFHPSLLCSYPPLVVVVVVISHFLYKSPPTLFGIGGLSSSFKCAHRPYLTYPSPPAPVSLSPLDMILSVIATTSLRGRTVNVPSFHLSPYIKVSSLQFRRVRYPLLPHHHHVPLLPYCDTRFFYHRS